jgi:hypothetical protein
MLTAMEGSQYFHHRQLWYLACEARDRCRAVEPPIEPGDALVAIIMAVSSAESFINGLAALARSRIALRARVGDTPPAHVTALAAALSKDKAELAHKYAQAGLALDQKLKGKAPHQELVRLIKLRNGLIHNRPDHDPDLIPEVQALVHQGLARSPSVDVR